MQPLALSLMSCPSAPSSSPWRSLTTRNMVPSSTTPPCCPATGELQLSTGEWWCHKLLGRKKETKSDKGVWIKLKRHVHWLKTSKRKIIRNGDRPLLLDATDTQDADSWWQKGRVHSVLGRWWTGHRTNPAAAGVWCWTQWHRQHYLQEVPLPRGS